ncbi:MAG: hypothetical protein U0169_03065 [Polyangiaceae bacterium]
MRRATPAHDRDPDDPERASSLRARTPSPFVAFVLASLVAFFLLSVPGSSAARAQSVPTAWSPSRGGFAFTITTFVERTSTRSNVGGLVGLTIPLGTIAAWLVERSPPSASTPPRLAGPVVARRAVLAAFRAVGLGADDRTLASIVARARMASLLPEVRLRATRSANDEITFDEMTSTSRYSGDGGRSLWLEARLTWRLDRLLFVDEELGTERIRSDRADGRVKLAIRVIEALVRWERAAWDADSTEPESHERGEAVLALEEATLLLDALTGGWFAEWAATTPGLAGAVARSARVPEASDPETRGATP